MSLEAYCGRRMKYFTRIILALSFFGSLLPLTGILVVWLQSSGSEQMWQFMPGGHSLRIHSCSDGVDVSFINPWKNGAIDPFELNVYRHVRVQAPKQLGLILDQTGCRRWALCGLHGATGTVRTPLFGDRAASPEMTSTDLWSISPRPVWSPRCDSGPFIFHSGSWWLRHCCHHSRLGPSACEASSGSNR